MQTLCSKRYLDANIGSKLLKVDVQTKLDQPKFQIIRAKNRSETKYIRISISRNLLLTLPLGPKSRYIQMKNVAKTNILIYIISK